MMYARTQTADVLKGIAILLMIQVHILELFADQNIYASSVGKVALFLGGPPVAPVFMSVFGYFLFSSNKSVGQLMLRGLKIFALGMFLNLALNCNLLLSVYKGTLHVDVWPYIFGVDILQFAGLSLLVIAPLKKRIQQYNVLILVMIVVAVFSSHYLMNYLPENKILKYISAFIYGSTEWSYFPLFPWIAYPLSGIALYQLQQQHDFKFFYLPKTKLLFGIIFFLFFILTIQYAISVSSDLQRYYHHGALFFMWVIIFSIFYNLLIYEFHQWMRKTLIAKYLMWLGRNVTLMYVIQWVFIGNISTEIYKTISTPFYLVVWFLVITIAASGLAYLLLRLKGAMINKQAI